MKEKQKQQYFDGPLPLILYFMRGSRGLFLLSMVFAAAVSFLDMILPGLISFTVDRTTRRRIFRRLFWHGLNRPEALRYLKSIRL